MATVTPIASVRTILDAADDAAASSGVLALLEDQEVEVASIELPRTGGLVKPADTLTLDAEGRLVVNDNDRAGGRAVADDRRYRGTLYYDASATAAEIYDNFVTIPLTAAECAVNATYQLLGTIRTNQSGGTKIEYVLGLLAASTNTVNAGGADPATVYGVTTTTSQILTESHINFLLKNVAGVLTLQTTGNNSLEWRKEYSGTDVTLSRSIPANIAATFPSSAQNLYIHVDSYGGGTTALTIDYDLQLIVTKP